MRAVLQRVSQCSVEVEGKTVGEIGTGLCVLLGITHNDSEADIAWLVRKITRLRIFSDPEGKMNLSVQDVQGSIMVISQFTLFANSNKGNRPSYNRSAPPEVAVPLYQAFIGQLSSVFDGPIATGSFGAMMEVSLVNDGPVTILLDSQEPTF